MEIELEVEVNGVVYNIIVLYEPEDTFVDETGSYTVNDETVYILEVYDAEGGTQNLIKDICDDSLTEMQDQAWQQLQERRV